MEVPPKPFHQSILDAIAWASNAAEMTVLGQLIKETVVPKGHDDIAAAWTAKATELGMNDAIGVAESVLMQKQTESMEA